MSSTDEQPTVECQVRRYLRRHEIASGSTILIALSGGPDSNCLASVLQQLRDSYPLNLYAAYLDHGIRGAREREEELRSVQSTCAAVSIQLTWKRLPSGLLQRRSAEKRESLEEMARRARYAFLHEAAVDKGCDFIALGHTADDQVETVVMRFFQGVGLGGLPGIPPIRGQFIRPLIGCSRAQILEHLDNRGLAYVTDSTNRDTRYLRNAVRWELLPAIERVFPGFRGSVLSISKKFTSLRDYVASESRRMLEWKPVSGGYGISGKLFLAAPAPLRLDSVTRMLDTLAPGSGRVPYRFLSSVQEDEVLLSRRVVLRGYGIRLFWRGEELILSADVVAHNEKGYFIEELDRGRVLVPAAGLVFEFGAPVCDPERLLFRSSRTGDEIALEGGRRAVNKLFAQWRVAGSERWKIPIVEGQGGIVAVLGALFGFEDRFASGLPHEQGKALKRMVHRYDVEVE